MEPDGTEIETYTTFATEHVAYTVSTGTSGETYTATLKRHTPVDGTVSISGIPSDHFTVDGKVITFDSEVENLSDGDIMEISYEYEVADAKVALIDNKTSAIGEAVFKWPVYDSGEDCTESSIKGYVVMRLFRCRVTQMPGFDTSLDIRFLAQQCA